MASGTYATSDATVSVGRVFSRGFGVLRDNPATVFGIALLFNALPSLLLNLLRFDLLGGSLAGVRNPGEAMLGFGATSLLFAVTGLVFYVIVQGALVRATVAYSEGRRASFGESVSVGLKVILPLIGLGILLALGIALGFILLVVPGVIVAVMWAVAAPALVEERIGVFAAFGRSRWLTKGARWRVFGVEVLLVVLIYLVLILSALIVARPTTLAAAQQMSPGAIIFNIIVSTLLGTLWSTVQTALYVELRHWKEGPTVGGLAEIFA